MIALTLVLIAPCANARDRNETCSSYTTMDGTTHDTCREPGRKERTCTSYTTITAQPTLNAAKP